MKTNRTPMPMLAALSALIAILLASSLRAQTSVESESTDDDIHMLSPFEVRPESDRGYVATRALGATKTNTPLLELPHSVQVLNELFLEETKSNYLWEAARYVGNVNGGDRRSDTGTGNGGFTIRGMSVTTLQDNLEYTRFGLDILTPMSAIERIEVLKGASGVLYGTSGFGGAINYVRKKPKAEAQSLAQLQVGEHNFFKGVFDTTGPLLDRENVQVNHRLILEFQDSETPIDLEYWDRLYIAPSLDVRLYKNTVFSFALEYTSEDRIQSEGVPYFFPGIPDNTSNLPGRAEVSEEFGGIFLNLPPSFNRADPDDGFDRDVYRLHFGLEHRLNKDWSLKWSNVGAITDSDIGRTFLGNPGDELRFWPRAIIEDDTQYETFFSEVDLVGNFRTGDGVKHKLLIGMTVDTLKWERDRFWSNYMEPLNIFDPVHDGTLEDEPYRVDLTTQRSFELSGFVQDQVSLFDERLFVVIGARWDFGQLDTENRKSGSISQQTDEEWSPRLAGLFKINESLSLYSSFNSTFRPAPTGFSFEGRAFKSPTGEQKEVGLKFDIFEKSLSGELAFFELVSKDETRSDPAHPGFALQAGEVTSEGFDLDVGITLSENWQMMAGLGYVDSYVSADPNPNRIGLKQASIPEWSAGIWSKYSFSEGGLKGLGLGIGYIFRDDYFGGDEDFVVPSYDIFNLLVDYSWEKFRIALNVDNLFDEEYNVYQASARFGQPGLPRWAKLTVSREW